MVVSFGNCESKCFKSHCVGDPQHGLSSWRGVTAVVVVVGGMEDNDDSISIEEEDGMSTDDDKDERSRIEVFKTEW